MDAPIERLSRATKKTSSLSLQTFMIGAVPQARPARAVQSGNKMGGAVEDDWVDVGQIGAARRYYCNSRSVMMVAKLLGLSSGAGVEASVSRRPWSGLHVIACCSFILSGGS